MKKVQGMKAKQFFSTQYERAMELGRERDEHNTPFAELEKKFGLKASAGMSAYRIYNWYLLKKEPKKRMDSQVTVSFESSEIEAVEAVAREWRVPRAEAFRRIVREWMGSRK